MNLASILLDHPFPDDELLLHSPFGSVTAGEAKRAAAEVAEQVRAFGVEPGAAVGVRLPNGPAAVTAMFGVWLADAVYVPFNVRQTAAEVSAALDELGARALLDDEGLHSSACCGGSHPADTAFVTWTSGTTGAPKPVLHTHSSYFELLDRVLGTLRADPAKRPTPNLIPVSLALNAGIYNVLFGLRAGASIVIMDRFSTADFADLVRRHGIKSTVLPPAAMTMLADDAAVTDLSPLRYVRSITAPLSPLAARRFTEKFGVTVLNSYGQAEIGEVIGWTAADAREHPEKIGAAGRPHSGVDIKVAGSGEVGELLVRPPRTAAGLDADRFDGDGFVHTGDVARIDADGFVWIEGRLGDVINRGGNKVFPDHVEEVLRLSPGVRDVAVVGVPDERLGEVPVAFVVGDAADAELESLCREHLVPYKVPVAYRRTDALPRSDVGKVLRRELAARWTEAG
jgi:acyl-CoA synthetase (AMP-forming)/AMP-acid ligase II